MMIRMTMTTLWTPMMTHIQHLNVRSYFPLFSHRVEAHLVNPGHDTSC